MASQKEINDVIRRHSSAFTALEEFERTGKTIVKARLNFTISRDTAKMFREYCRSKGYNMSAKIEESIKKMLTA